MQSDDDDTEDYASPADIAAVQKAAEADALTIWTVHTNKRKVIAVELSFGGKECSFKHTFTNRKDAEETVEAFKNAIENCWPTKIRNLNLH
jgi:hypothetical protein